MDMKAVTFNRFGGSEVLQVAELPEPIPARNEVAIEVVATAVNPTDVMMRNGQHAALMTSLKPPYIAGMELAGFVRAKGAEVAGFEIGQAAMAIVNPRRASGGAHAQYVCVPAASVAALRPGADLVAAAIVPMNGLTARMALEALALPRGSVMLITGGAGVVARYAIQLAKRAGLVIVADARPADVAAIHDLGVDHVVSRGPEMAAQVRALFPDGVDGLIDTAVLGDAAAALVKAGGATVSLRRSSPITDARLRNVVVSVLDQVSNTAALQELADLFDEGVIAPRPPKPIPLAEAREAYRLTEAGGLGGRAVLLMKG
jgi:NADPH2:quinone reductase